MRLKPGKLLTVMTVGDCPEEKYLNRLAVVISQLFVRLDISKFWKNSDLTVHNSPFDHPHVKHFTLLQNEAHILCYCPCCSKLCPDETCLWRFSSCLE